MNDDDSALRNQVQSINSYESDFCLDLENGSNMAQAEQKSVVWPLYATYVSNASRSHNSPDVPRKHTYLCLTDQCLCFSKLPWLQHLMDSLYLQLKFLEILTMNLVRHLNYFLFWLINTRFSAPLHLFLWIEGGGFLSPSHGGIRLLSSFIVTKTLNAPKAFMSMEFQWI